MSHTRAPVVTDKNEPTVTMARITETWSFAISRFE
jgi:hypothetical protein